MILVGIVLGALIGSLFFHGEAEGIVLGAILGWLVVDRIALPGVVTLQHMARNQRGEVVATATRTALVRMRPDD